jgi:hypothetical protein
VSTQSSGSQPCDADRLGLSTAGYGGAGGTDYVVLHVRLVTGGPCRLADSPAVAILDKHGNTVVSGQPQDASTVALVDTTDLRLGWSSWCALPPTGPLVARLTMATGSVDVTLPSDFIASCQGSPSSVFIEPIVK